MEDLVSMCEHRCRKACNLRSAAEDSDGADKRSWWWMFWWIRVPR